MATPDPATTSLLRFFRSDHLPPHLRVPSQECEALAHKMVDLGLDGPELTAGLRKLLEAKDCFVRAQISESEELHARIQD